MIEMVHQKADRVDPRALDFAKEYPYKDVWIIQDSAKKAQEAADQMHNALQVLYAMELKDMMKGMKAEVVLNDAVVQMGEITENLNACAAEQKSKE